jgi:myo-inositol 2-dehydrogenase / D-chiro-inositol 1-dehydrogenase
MKKGTYGILLVTGSHTHQENYGAAFAADPRCKIVAVTDEPAVGKRRRDLNERLARKLGVPYVADLDEALKRKEVSVVSICAEPERRARIAIRCAKAGKHLYLDKSLAPRLEETDALVAAVNKAGVRSQMFTLVTTPSAAQARSLLKDGRLGTLRALHADTFFAKGKTGTAELGSPRKEEFPPARHQLVEAKREFDNVGVYPLALIHWLTGKKFRTVYAVTGNYFFQEHQKNNVEDFGLLSGTLEDGVPVSVSAGRYGWTTHPGFGTNRLLMAGTRQSVLIDANRPRLEVYTDEAPWLPPRVHPEDPMGFWSSTQEEVGARPKRGWVAAGPAARSDAAHFIDCLENDRDGEVSVTAAAHITEVLIAAYRSAARKEVVTLPLRR